MLQQAQAQTAALQHAKADSERSVAELRLQIKVQGDAIKSVYSKHVRDAAVQSDALAETHQLQHGHENCENNPPPSAVSQMQAHFAHLQQLCGELFAALPEAAQEELADRCKQYLPAGMQLLPQPEDAVALPAQTRTPAPVVQADSPAPLSELTSPESACGPIHVSPGAADTAVMHNNAASDTADTTPEVLRRSLRATFGLHSGSASQFRDPAQADRAWLSASHPSPCGPLLQLAMHASQRSGSCLHSNTRKLWCPKFGQLELLARVLFTQHQRFDLAHNLRGSAVSCTFNFMRILRSEAHDDSFCCNVLMTQVHVLSACS